VDIDIRLLGRDEADILLAADPDVFDHPVRRDYAEAFLADPDSLIAVAMHYGKVVGMASAFTYRHPDKARQMFINEVGVATPYHRRGIAAAMLRRLLEAARSLGCIEAWVATEEGNSPARALYRSLGGQEDASRAVIFTYGLRPDRAGSENVDTEPS
jgi:GNAT superfamily N-acetyltransferase